MIPCGVLGNISRDDDNQPPHSTRLRMTADDDGPVKAAMGSICTEHVRDDGPVDLLDGVHMHGASAQPEVVKVPLSTIAGCSCRTHVELVLEIYTYYDTRTISFHPV